MDNHFIIGPTETTIYQICLPMWCNYPRQNLYETDVQAHHRIVRIPPGESVVLNSAERAPYLLYLEIFHGDLDFDPTKRSNKELLSRLAKEQSGNKGLRKAINASVEPTQAVRFPRVVWFSSSQLL